MFLRVLIPMIAVLLFLLESEFAMFSPIIWNENTLILVPRFLILYLIFITIYYNRNRAIFYGLIFGVLYDIFYIDIIGLYSVLYPLVCIIAGWSVKRIHPHLVFSTVLAILLIGLLEFILYEFFFWINFTTMSLDVFLYSRLIPTVLANSLFLIMLGWAFKYLIKARELQHARNNS